MDSRQIPRETRMEAYIESRAEVSTMRRKVYETLKYGPMTAETLMAAMGFMNPNSIRPRLTELRDAGMIRAKGKTKNPAGRNVTLWEVIPENERTAPGAGNTEGGERKRHL